MPQSRLSSLLHNTPRTSKKTKLAKILLFSLTITSISSYFLYKLWHYVYQRHIAPSQLQQAAQRPHLVTQSQLSEIFLHRMRKSFQNNRKTSLNALRTQLNKCLDTIKVTLNVENDVSELKNHSSGSSRTLYWQKIKIGSVLRVLTGVCALGIMHLFLCIQINMVSRYLFLKHVSQEKEKWRRERREYEEKYGAIERSWWQRWIPFMNRVNPDDAADSSNSQEDVIDLTPEVQQEFVSFISHFPDVGLDKLVQIIEPYARKHLEPLSLKHAFENHELNDLINRVRRDAFPDIVNEIQTLTLPPEHEDVTKHPQLRCLLDEMRDILESPPFANMLQVSFDCGFNVLFQHVEHVFRQMDQKHSGSPVSGSSHTVHLAKILPHITKEIERIFDDDLTNEYITRLYEDETIIRYLASVYGAVQF